MTIKIQELFNEYNIDSSDIPPRILEIELNEDLKNFNKGYKNKDTYTFKGAYQPVWMEVKAELEVTLLINLSNYSKKLIQASIDFDDGKEPSVEITNEIFTRFLSEKVVTHTQEIKDNFTSHTTYNILGGIITEQ